MHAMVLHEFSGPLKEEIVPDPEPGYGEAVVRVRACAVDQFDLTIRKGLVEGTKLPLILGHEVAGEVAAVGDGVENLEAGDRVASTLYFTCGHCRPCRSGAETVCENFYGYLGELRPFDVAEALGGTPALLLAGHGVVCVGGSIEESVTVLIALEDTAKLQLTAGLVGDPKPIAARHVEGGLTHGIEFSEFVECTWAAYAARVGKSKA